MKVQRSSTLPAIHSADKNDKNKSERRTSRTFHSEERPITKQTNPYLLKIWKSRSLSRRHVDRRLVFKVDDATPEAVKRIFRERGWMEYVRNGPASQDKWHLYWKCATFKPSDYDFLLGWQVINHFPKTFNISKKDCLARNLKRMKAVYGAHLFNFFPKTYILPKDYPRLISQYTDMKEWNQCVKNQLKRSARLSPRKNSAGKRDSSQTSDSASSKNADGRGDWTTSHHRKRRSSSPSKRKYSYSNSSSGTDKNNNNNNSSSSKNTKKNTKSNKSKGSTSPNKNGNRGDSSDNNSARKSSGSPVGSKNSEARNDEKSSKTKKDEKTKDTASEKKSQVKNDVDRKEDKKTDDRKSGKSPEKNKEKKGGRKDSNSLQGKVTVDSKADSDDGGRSKRSNSEGSIKKGNPQNPGGITWIAKPSSNSQGKGIHIIRDLNDLMFNTSTVVQRYIDKPMLISGYKFDLRLYVIIASFHPLTIYLYREGLVRFATDKFDMNELTNVYAHLTNTSINKGSPSYSDNKDSVGPGCIWALSRLRAYLENENSSTKRHPSFTWHKIANIICLTILTLSNHIPPQAYNCFELLGFDILLDERLKPWLLEVNISPALTTNTHLDAHVKLGVLRHTVFLCERLFFSEFDDQDDDGSNELTIYRYHRDTAGKKRSRNNFIRSNPSDFFQPRVGVFSRSRYQKPIPTSLGDLRLIFPFNDETRRATSTEFHDTRTAVLEIQKRDAIVQRRLESYSAKKRSNSTNQKMENLLLWCP